MAGAAADESGRRDVLHYFRSQKRRPFHDPNLFVKWLLYMAALMRCSDCDRKHLLPAHGTNGRVEWVLALAGLMCDAVLR